MKKKNIVGVIMSLAMICATSTSAFAATPVYQNGFDGDLGGAKVLTRTGDTDTGSNPGTMPEESSSVAAQFADGKNGKALSLDGSYGLVLDTKAVGDTYSVSFWINPARFSNFTPMLQIGSDLLSAKTSAKWLNITKTDWDGDIAPVVWSRNEVTGAFPWYCKAYFTAGGGYTIPKNEWSHIVVTVDSSKKCIDPVTGDEIKDTVNSQLYINGEFIGEGPVATETFTGSSKVYLGINCWDILFKGLYDDVKIYDTVLSADEVKTAMNEAVVSTATDTAATTTDAATDTAATTDTTSTTSVPKTGVASFALLFGLGAAACGAGSVALKKKEK